MIKKISFNIIINMSKNAHEMIDNQIPLSFVPKNKIEKNDAGIKAIEYHQYIPREPANYGYQQTSSLATFVINGQGLENLRDAKLYGKVKLGGTSVTKGTLDGGIQALFSEVQVQTRDNTVIEHLKRNNRVMQSLKLCSSGKENLKQKFESWDDGLYKNENATAGTSEVPYFNQDGTTPFAVTLDTAPRKRHLTTTAQEFCLNLSDISLFVRNNNTWNSDKNKELKITLQFDKDGNILSSCNIVTAGVAQVIVTELKLVVPCYKLEESFANQLQKVDNELITFESYRVFPVACAAAQQTINIQAGLNNVTGGGILPRLSSEENTVGDIATPAAVRYLTGAPNSAITSLQFICGDLSFPRQPITNSYELYNFQKDFFKVNQDTDNANLINAANWVSADQNTSSFSLESCDMRHYYFDLSKNGLGTGIDINVRELLINVEQTAVSNLVFDVVLFYTRVLQIQGDSFRTMV
jgi:hypothetical protein